MCLSFVHGRIKARTVYLQTAHFSFFSFVQKHSNYVRAIVTKLCITFFKNILLSLDLYKQKQNTAETNDGLL